MKQRWLMWGPKAGMVAALVIGSEHLAVAQMPTELSSVATTREIAPQEKRAEMVTFEAKEMPLKAVLEEFARQSGTSIATAANERLASTQVTVAVHNRPVFDAVRAVLQGTGFRAEMSSSGRILVTLAEEGKRQEDGVIVGKVIHAKTKQPVAGATVRIGNDSKGVITGADGTFRILAAAGKHTVQVRMVGFVRQAVQVDVVPGETVNAEIIMEPSASVLDEVVVTGTVVATERKAIPNPITVITAEEIERRGITRIEQFLRGEVPGVYALDEGARVYDAELGAMSSSQIYSRGSSNLGVVGETTPLKTYVDGVEILDPSYLGTIDPASIERIEIVTGPQAATVYGSGAMGGVMQIFTKKGKSTSSPEVTLNLAYGILKNNFTPGNAPSHKDAINITGGSGPDFSYAVSGTYNYIGQWQPKLFNRRYGMSVGATHIQGGFIANGSVSVTRGVNGVYEGNHGIFGRTREESGEYWDLRRFNGPPSSRRSTSASQTVSLSLDYRQQPWVQHHLTVGTSQTEFDLIPVEPRFGTPSDSLFASQSSTGRRTTIGINTTISPIATGLFSTTLSLGITGSQAKQAHVDGFLVSKNAASYHNPTSSALRVDRTIDDKSFGGFGRWQLGIASHFYLTLGLRGERNPSYGTNHKIDWTPTNGATYTFDVGDMTLKFLASYGRATRAPLPEWRLEEINVTTIYDPPAYVSQFSNPDLRPEYSRGPQGGVEIYYGNAGALTINHYQQTVTDLIQWVTVDSVEVLYLGSPRFVPQRQYQNVAKVRQHGWELTGTANFRVLSLKGTYTWADSRVAAVPPGSSYWVGQSFQSVPTHFGNITASFAHGGTSVILGVNYRGAMIGTMTGDTYLVRLAYDNTASRLRQYVLRRNTSYSAATQAGYLKSNLAISHQLVSWMSVRMNVENLGNSYAGEGSALTPTLGRMTTLGLSLRFPRR